MRLNRASEEIREIRLDQDAVPPLALSDCGLAVPPVHAAE